jgi:hypothetical protein
VATVESVRFTHEVLPFEPMRVWNELLPSKPLRWLSMEFLKTTSYRLRRKAFADKLKRVYRQLASWSARIVLSPAAGRRFRSSNNTSSSNTVPE